MKGSPYGGSSFLLPRRRRDTTEGFFSRWVVVPFTAFFPAGVADTTLIDRLTRQESLQGLLRMAVGGLQSVMRRGSFINPPSVRRATQRFREEADPIRGFIRERLRGGNGFVARTELYVAYTSWATINGYAQMSNSRFYEQLMAAILESIPVRNVIREGIRGYAGIEIANN